MEYKFDGFDFERLVNNEITIPKLDFLALIDMSPAETRVYLVLIALQFGAEKRTPTFSDGVVTGDTPIDEISFLSGLTMVDVEAALRSLVERSIVSEIEDGLLTSKSYYI